MNKQEAIDLIGPQLLAVWPSLSEDQQTAIYQDMNQQLQTALDIALGLIVIDEAQSMPQEAVDAVTQWIDTHGQPEVTMPAIFVPDSGDRMPSHFVGIGFTQPAVTQHATSGSFEFEGPTFSKQHKKLLRNSARPEEPKRLANALAVGHALLAILAVLAMAWYASGRQL